VLESFTLQTFSVHVDEDFAIALLDGGELTARLIEATSRGVSPAEGLRAPFSIIFRGPAEPTLPQGVHRVRHDAIGSFELFLVPIEPDADGPRYEAVFG
jgi:hypothetical protein